MKKAQRQRINMLSAEVVKAQRAAIKAIAAELERRRQKEPPFEWDPSVLASIAAMPMPEFEPVDLSGLAEDVNLDGLFDELHDLSTIFDGTPGPPIFIPIDDE